MIPGSDAAAAVAHYRDRHVVKLIEKQAGLPGRNFLQRLLEFSAKRNYTEQAYIKAGVANHSLNAYMLPLCHTLFMGLGMSAQPWKICC